MATRFNTSSPMSTNNTMHPLTIIECEICKSHGFSCLDYAEAEALMCEGSVSRYCRTCNKNTMWKQLNVPSPKASFNFA